MRSLLPRKCIYSDKEALQLSAALRRLGLDGEARTVEISRGTWWIQTQRNTAKAMFFFCRANDMSRVASLCEKSTWECISSIVKDLNLHGDSKKYLDIGPQLPLRVSGSQEVLFASEESDSSSIKECSERARDLLAVIGVNCYESYGRILERGDFPCNEAYFLFYYIRIISNARSLPALEEEGMNLEIETGMPYEADSFYENLVEAAKCISFALMNSIAPLRFWLHLIELAAWIEEKKEKYEKTRDFASRFLFTKEAAYLLMTSLDKVETHYSAKRLRLCRTTSVSDVVKTISNLRIRLMQIWSLSVIGDNAALKSEVKVSPFGAASPATSAMENVSEACLLISSLYYS